MKNWLIRFKCMLGFHAWEEFEFEIDRYENVKVSCKNCKCKKCGKIKYTEVAYRKERAAAIIALINSNTYNEKPKQTKM